ncbi:DUF4153 domain-containing protein [Brevundimonas viscosa]|uniref:DUF4153 domain-containing protein n=1 Tax=Brevundimonas viscosa TaxID=871741 RepID=A0A1I6TMF2_9CAUL|nr:DUF4153 domain-containing protein [Brevundimonas viscosa]SFS90311.1 protein of unknown function [Brevundimonas viscosa]
MIAAEDAMDRDVLRGPPTRLLGPLRLGIGLLQGLALWWLHWTSDGVTGWPWAPAGFVILVLLFAFIPVLLLAGVGRMHGSTLAAWTVVAVALLALMGWHEVARQSADTLRGPPFFTTPMPLFAAAALFIAHHLVLAADMERRWIAPFPVYFDTAWKAGVQLVLSVGFTGAFWILLFLGAGLFRIIGLDFLEDLTRKSWFYVPVTTFVFATAVHLTDVRDGLIRGVRTVGLMLLSWLLLVMTVLAAGFVLALPFTGLKGLWDTGSGTSLVLAAAAALIVLINAAYQDGRPENRPPLAVRLAVQVGSLLLLPLIVIAFLGLALRIGQHGLTPDRIIALACALVGAVFAVGYAWASLRTFLRRGDWMRPVEPTTLAGAVVAFGLIVALFSPLLDPARLSVADQVARLERGAVAPEAFDYAFLRFGSRTAGQGALERLARSADPVIVRNARNMLATENTVRIVDVGSPDTLPRLEVVPAGAALPEGFLVPVPPTDDRAQCGAAPDRACVASSVDLDGDGESEVLVADASGIRLWTRGPDGRWSRRGGWYGRRCPDPAGAASDPRDALRQGQVQPLAPRWPDLQIGGTRHSVLIDAPECGVRTSPGSAD